MFFLGRCTKVAAHLLYLSSKNPPDFKNTGLGSNSVGPRRRCSRSPLFPIEGGNAFVLCDLVTEI